MVNDHVKNRYRIVSRFCNSIGTVQTAYPENISHVCSHLQSQPSPLCCLAKNRITFSKPTDSSVNPTSRTFHHPNIRRPPLWSSGQSSWLQVQKLGFDSRRYQIFWDVVGLQGDLLSLVSTTEELHERKCSGSGRKAEITAVGIRHADHVKSSILRKSWH
jgi:hypothetical protein